MRTPDKRISRARRLRRDVTDAERKLWWHLKRLPRMDSHFRRQATIGPYFADFACHTRRLVIELDGGHHAQAPQAARDGTRDAYFRMRGYRVVRFWNNDVIENIDGVLSIVWQALNPASPPPTPDPSPPLASLAGGGESQRLGQRTNA